MIYQQGTAANHIDLFDKVFRLLTGAGVVSNLAYTGTGDGLLLNLDAHPAAVAETWTVTCTAAAADGGTFSVTGSVSGSQADATVGAHYDNGLVFFDLTDGPADYIAGDEFTFDVAAGVMPAAERWTANRVAGVQNIASSSYRVNYEDFRVFKSTYNAHTNSWATAIGQHLNCWISWEFFRPYDIDRIELQASGSSDQAPTEFELQYSDDGSNWITREVFSGVSWANNERKEWTLTGTSPGAKKFWRIYITANGGNADTTAIQEISFLEFQSTEDFDFGRRPSVWLKAPGLTGNGPAYVIFTVYDRPTDDYYNWAINIGTGFLDDSDITNQPGVAAGGLPMWNGAMDYWLAVDGQHIELNVRVDTVTLPIYVGKFLPYGTPGQYPYPAIIAAPLASASAARYSDGSVALPFKGNRSQMKIRDTVGNWVNAYAWPYSNGATFRDTGGDYPILPIILYDASNTYGTLDGIKFVTGFNNAAENVVQVGAEDHTVFRDGALTGLGDYYTMRTQ